MEVQVLSRAPFNIMKLNINPYKGSRDFYPEDKRVLKYLFAKLTTVVQSYGYEEYDAPMLEEYDLYAAKSGTEIVSQQTYNFTDRAGRKLAIRPEMTPSVSRMVARKRQELSYPLRLYSIPNLWRYERQQKGRFREHWQLNVDLFGLSGLQGDNEIISVADDIFQALGASRKMYKIKLNSRKFMEYFFNEFLGLNDEKTKLIMKLIDGVHKMAITDFISQVDEIIDDSDRQRLVVEKLIDLIKTDKIKDLPDKLKNHSSLDTIKEVFRLNDDKINLVFDPTIMRGFDYYTDIVFEVFDEDPDNNRSMMGGGRYDGLVGLFGVEPISTVGFGLGDATLFNFVNNHGLLPDLPTETDIYAISLDVDLESINSILKSIRRNGINIAEGWRGKKMSDQITIALKKKIPYVLIIGPEEIKTGKLTLKELSTKKEYKLDTSELINFFNDK